MERSDAVIIALFVAVIAICIYFFPSYIAFRRTHRNKVAITALNTLLGWTFVGWVVSLVWALTN